MFNNYQILIRTCNGCKRLSLGELSEALDVVKEAETLPGFRRWSISGQYIRLTSKTNVLKPSNNTYKRKYALAR